MADKPQIEGLPAGAELKPIEGLPAGAELRPVVDQTQEPDSRNTIQRAFDKITTVTPEQQHGHGSIVNGLQKFGAGVIQGVGQPFVHPIDTLTGMAKFAADPTQGTGELAHSVMENPMQAAGNVVGGGILGEGAGMVGEGLAKAIPTTAKAGRVFQSLNQDLANQPVGLTRSAPHLEHLAQIDAAGPSMPGTVNKLLNRSQATFPMNYPEARLFQENLASPSTTEKMGMGGSMKGGVKQLNKAFYEDIHDAANQAGRGEDYAKAMRDYRIASTVGNAAKNIGKIAVPAAIGGGTYKLTRALEGGR